MMVWVLRFPFFGQGHRLSGLDPEHLGARSRSAYGRGRQAIADGVAESLARRKARERRNGSGSGEKPSGDAVDEAGADDKEVEVK